MNRTEKATVLGRFPHSSISGIERGGATLSKWIEFDDLCKRWNMNKYDLADLVIRGELISNSEDDYSAIVLSDDNTWYEMPDDDTVPGGLINPACMTIGFVMGRLFLRSRVEAYDEKFDRKPRSESQVQDAFTGNEKAAHPIYENAFKCDGDGWEIWFKGEKLGHIKKMNGITYIANLLLRPNQFIHVTSLCNSIGSENEDTVMGEDEIKDSLRAGTMSVSDMEDDALDAKAKEEIKKKIHALEETIDDPELPESERIQAEIDLSHLTTTLERDYGLKPLHTRAPRKVTGEVKKELDRAGKSITRALDKIREQSPELAEYLKKSIKTGTQYSFTDTGTIWHVTL